MAHDNTEPPDPETIPTVLQEKVDKWMTYFTNLSERIVVLKPGDEKFDLPMFKRTLEDSKIADIGDNKITISDWPDEKDVSFGIAFDDSIPGHEKRYLMSNTYLFCKKNAFGIDYFQCDSDDIGYDYSLQSYPESALEWNYVAKLIRGKIVEIENSIPDNVPLSDEPLFSDAETCICPADCDCQNPPPEDWDGKEGTYLVSQYCPVHNQFPAHDTECSAKIHNNGVHNH